MVKNLETLIGKTVCVKLRPHNYTFPKAFPDKTSFFSIVRCELIEVTEGTVIGACLSNGYLVIRGNMPRLFDKQEYVFRGTLYIDPKYGPQYECISIDMDYTMDNIEEQKDFFRIFMAESYIDALFTAYKDPIKLVENKDYDSLCQVKGVGPATAKRICDKYEANFGNRKAYAALGKWLTKNAIDKIVEQLGSVDLAIDTVVSNPYSLITLVNGFGWEKADALALKQGFKTDCPERCLAYLKFRVDKLAREDGSTKMFVTGLIKDAVKICVPATTEQIQELIKKNSGSDKEIEESLQKEKEHIFYERPAFYIKNDYISSFENRLLSKKIALELKRLKEARQYTKFNKEVCDSIIEKTEEDQGFKYTYEQRRAIGVILASNVSILTGGAGVGKSSTLTPLIKIFKHYGLTVAQCALSGRASSLLTEYTGLEGKTIHRTLGYTPEKEGFMHSATNPLDADVVIIDETSMVGEDLFYPLISSIKSGAKLIMLGDTHQLPPISTGAILNDCIQSGYIVSSKLTIVQRQALKSGIVSESVKVCEGKRLVESNTFVGEEFRGELQDFKLICENDSLLVHEKVIQEYTDLLNKKHINPLQIQVITPMRVKGINSCHFLNQRIQSIVNPQAQTKGQTITWKENGAEYSTTFGMNDRVIIMKNNYKARSQSGGKVPIYNGNMGVIIQINQEQMTIRMLHDEDIVVIIPREEWYNINLAYACTAHRLQGSQAPYVLVCVDSSAFALLIREWLYTAITRARVYCTLIGRPETINMAVKVSDTHIKQTWLKGDLLDLYYAENGLERK